MPQYAVHRPDGEVVASVDAKSAVPLTDEQGAGVALKLIDESDNFVAVVPLTWMVRIVPPEQADRAEDRPPRDTP